MTVWTPVEPLLDEPAPEADYWPAFKIGDRVRVRLSGECPAKGPTRATVGGPVIEGQAHPAWQDGVTGTVVRCPCPPCAFEGIGHPVVVAYIHPEQRVSWQGHYAAAELEPIDGD